MALTLFTGFESGTPADCGGAGGTYEISAAAARTGNYGLRIHRLAGQTVGWGNVGANITTNGYQSESSSYSSGAVRVYFKYKILPTTSRENIITHRGNSPYTTKWIVAINPNATLSLYSASGVLLATGTLPLRYNQWHCIDRRILI